MSSWWAGGGVATGGPGCGRSSGTLWLATGMMMMNMISSTSITSTSGVVLISTIGAKSPLGGTVADAGRMVAAKLRQGS